MGTELIITWGIRGLVVLAFLILGAREVAELFRRHDKRMGRGWGRVWAVARATMWEAWAGRVWLLPGLWFVAALLMILATRPFDESERIPLYIKALLSSQEVLLLIMMWVMACVSLPRERERKIMITNASKPLSRLEILLGKIVGFGVVAAGLLGVMGAGSLVILEVSDFRVRARAKEAYELQVRDFNKSLVAPSEALKQLSEEGSLYAYNFITVPPGGLNIGMLSLATTAAETTYGRWFIGGTNEKAVFRFWPRLEVHEATLMREPGRRPTFVLYFPWVAATGVAAPEKVEILVRAYGSGPSAAQEKVLTLDDGMMAIWEPEQPDQVFSSVDSAWQLTRDRGAVTVEARCLTPGVMVRVFEGADPDAEGNMPETEWNVQFFDRRENLQMGLRAVPTYPQKNPTVRGGERRDRQEVAAATARQPLDELAIYRFPGSSLRNVPVDREGNFQLSLQLDTYKGDNPERGTVAAVEVRSLDRRGQPSFKKQDLEVREKRVMTLAVPGDYLGNKDPSKRGDMLVMVYCRTPGHSVTVLEDSVRIELPQTPFFVNWFKSEAVILMEALLLITLSVACSVRVGWPVAMLCSGVGVLFGVLQRLILSLPEYGGLGALNYQPLGYNPALFNFFDQATSYLWALLGMIAILVPDFTQFQSQAYIGNLQNMPWSVFFDDVTGTLTFVLPFIGLAYLLFRKQELG